MQKPRTISFDGTGTHWECEIIDDIELSKLNTIKAIILDKLDDFTNKYSRFDDNSLIGKLNTSHYIANPPKEMCEMFCFAKKMFEVSDRAFDITVGGELSAKGYGQVSNAEKVNHEFWDNIKISDDHIATPLYSVIDFGGFGKGWLIDCFVDIFRDNGIRQFIINGGGDLFVQADKPINIALEHPFDSSLSVGQTLISKGALAVSSTAKRAWVQNSKSYNHIINPVNGKSLNGDIISTFIKADTALIADTMATILLIRPDLDQVLSEQFNLKTILLSNDQLKIK